MTRYISIRSGATALPEQSVAHLSHDITLQSGVLDLLANHWKVSEHNPQNMSVDIALGRGYFKKLNMTYHGYTDAIESVVITANNSGNPRISAIVGYVDLSVIPNAESTNNLKFIEVPGAAAASPVPALDSEIQNAIGSGNPFQRLAHVTVPNGATAIPNSNIADARSPAYFKFLSGIKDTDIVNPNITNAQVNTSYQKIMPFTDAGTIPLDMNVAQAWIGTINGNRLFSVQNMKVGQKLELDITFGTGNLNPSFSIPIDWPDQVIPVFTPIAGKTDSVIIKCYAVNKYRGYIAGQNYL